MQSRLGTYAGIVMVKSTDIIAAMFITSNTNELLVHGKAHKSTGGDIRIESHYISSS
ncbi:hypothetical protein HGRIS_005543 [Hohenbuehelia grisea]|uniref:Uncharacterized protein n=1 Tax=Hohenbuehelia grisea TaxID=104357 RepID=A0ABR3JZ86_9AGAR